MDVVQAQNMEKRDAVKASEMKQQHNIYAHTHTATDKYIHQVNKPNEWR